MPIWIDSPGDEYSRPRWQLLRCKPTGAIRGIILSEKHVGTLTHYWKGRTVPHETTLCEACAAGRAPRPYCYLAIETGAARERVILELTATGFAPIIQYLTEKGSLRGALIEAWRVVAKPNGRLHVTIKPGNAHIAHLPPAPDLRALLCRIWEIEPSFNDVANDALEHTPRLHTQNGPPRHG